MQEQRRLLVEPGTRIDSFSVTEAFGDRLELATLLARGPLVLVFFRFAASPARNIALPYYHRHLLPKLQTLGTQVLALSPHLPERLIGIKLRLGMDFLVACDRDNKLARRFGIAHTSETGTSESPMPAVILLDSQAVVRFVDVSPDPLDHTEAALVIAAVRHMTSQHAARRRSLVTS